MALEHRTVIGQLQIVRNGDVNLQLKLLIADGAIEFSETNHRTVIEKGANVAARLTAINATLVGAGRQPIGNKASLVIKQTAEACWAAMDA